MARILPPSVFRPTYTSPNEKFKPTQTQRIGEEWAKPEGIATAVGLADVVGGTIYDVVDQYKKKAEQLKTEEGPIDYRQAAARLAAAETQKEAGQAFGDMSRAYNAPGSGRLTKRWSGGPMDTMTEQYKRLLPRFPLDGKGRGGKGKKPFGPNKGFVESLEKQTRPGNAGFNLLAFKSLFDSNEQNYASDQTYFRGTADGPRLVGTPEQEQVIATRSANGLAEEASLRRAFQEMERKVVLEKGKPEADQGIYRGATNYQQQLELGMGNIGEIKRLGIMPTDATPGLVLAQMSELEKTRLADAVGFGNADRLAKFYSNFEKDLDKSAGIKGEDTANLRVKDVIKELARRKGKKSVYRPQSQWDPLYIKYGRKYGVPPALVQSVGWYESRHKPGETSKVHKAHGDIGARGVMQFMPGTGKEYGLNTPEDFFNPEKSIDAGARYLRDLLKRYEKHGPLATRFAVMAYNSGPGNVDEYIRSGGKKMLKTKSNPRGVVLRDPMEYGRHIPVLVRASALNLLDLPSSPEEPEAPAPVPDLVPLSAPRKPVPRNQPDAGPQAPAADAGPVSPQQEILNQSMDMFGLRPDAGQPPVRQSADQLRDTGSTVAEEPVAIPGAPLTARDEAALEGGTEFLDDETSDADRSGGASLSTDRPKRPKKPSRKGRAALRETAAAGNFFEKQPQEVKKKWMRAKPRGVSAFKWIEAFKAHKGNPEAAKQALAG